MDPPEVKYAKSGSVHIAYQLYGRGGTNIVYTPGLISHLDYYWREPGAERFFVGLGEFAKVALFDKRGTGLSDRETGIPTFEERMDDIRAVMDAAGFEKAVLFGASEGVAMSLLFAATYPSRTLGLISYGGSAKGTWSSDYPWEYTKQQYEEQCEFQSRTWGTVEQLRWYENRFKDKQFAKWFFEMGRAGASPGAYIALQRSYINMDIRSVLPAIHVPTLVLHRSGDQIGCGRYIASHIQGAKFVELPGTNHVFFMEPEIVDKILDEARRFSLQVAGPAAPASQDRILATVLFTDIADSTRKAAELGDIRWHSLLDQHNSMVKGEVARFSGAVVKNTGDGFLATFDGPTRAIRCAWAITKSAKDLGIEIRAGIHTGECVVSSDDVSGIAVHIASRILNEGSPGEVVVSSTVKDLVYGAGITFKDRGEYELKGVEDRRRLYVVERV